MDRRSFIVAGAALGISAPSPAAKTPAPKFKYVFPCIRDAQYSWDNRFAEENCYTAVDRYMTAITEDGRWFNLKVDSDAYRAWVAENVAPGEIPPHINFGGAVVSGKGDNTFYLRWKLRTLAHLQSGRLK